MGMLSINETCPHCLKENAVLSSIKEANLAVGFFSVVFQCQSCFRLLIAEIATGSFSSPEIQAKNTIYPIEAYSAERMSVHRTYPQKIAFEAPVSTPERAAKFFIEAKEDFSRGRYETSALHCRRRCWSTTEIYWSFFDLFIHSPSNGGCEAKAGATWNRMIFSQASEL